MGETGQDASTTTRILLVPTPATMLHAAVHELRFFDNLVARSAFDVANEPYAATVFLTCGVVEASLSREIPVKSYRHICSLLPRLI